MAEPPDVCPCCRFSRTDEIGQPCVWCRISHCRRNECRRALNDLENGDPS